MSRTFLGSQSLAVRFDLQGVMAQKRMFRIKDVADRAGVDRSRVSKIFHGHVQRVDLDTLDRLCNALDCEPGDLLVRVPSPAPEDAA